MLMYRDVALKGRYSNVIPETQTEEKGRLTGNMGTGKGQCCVRGRVPPSEDTHYPLPATAQGTMRGESGAEQKVRGSRGGEGEGIVWPERGRREDLKRPTRHSCPTVPKPQHLPVPTATAAAAAGGAKVRATPMGWVGAGKERKRGGGPFSWSSSLQTRRGTSWEAAEVQ